MPYYIKKVKDGYKVCKKDDTKCFSKEGLTEERAEKQMKAIGRSERLEGGLKPITARVGGKVLLKRKIVDDYFPKSESYSTYVEPFVGGGSIYFYKNKDEHKEAVNDIDPDIYTLFKGLQTYDAKRIADDINGDYTKKDFEEIQESEPEDAYHKFLKTYLLYKLSYFGRGLSFGKPRVNTSFKGYQERLKGVDITKSDYKEVIKKYNQPSTFFYLDPPVRESQGAYRFPAIDFVELAKVLHTIKGKFLLSIGKSNIDKELFKGYKIIPITTKYVGEKTKGGQTKKTKEFLVLNYEPGMSGGNLSGGDTKTFKRLIDGGLTLERRQQIINMIYKPDITTKQIFDIANELDRYNNTKTTGVGHITIESELRRVLDKTTASPYRLDSAKVQAINSILTPNRADNNLLEAGCRKCGGCMGACGGSMVKFHKQLAEVGLTHNIYMKKAKELAKASGYDPDKLSMAEDENHKLCYDGVCFGKVDYFDYIIYSWLESKGELPEGTADKKRKAYRARAKKARGDWKSNKLSPNNLAINILW